MKKEEIISRLYAGRENFLDSIQGLSDQEVETLNVSDQWTVKDILAHLTRWEAELVKLLWQAKNNVKPTTVHFNLQSVDKINARWHIESQSRALDVDLADFHGVREQTIRRVKSFSDSALNDPQHFPWLESKPLWKWIINDSIGHDAEHEAQIRSWRRREGLQE
jgi:hypothetical protein